MKFSRLLSRPAPLLALFVLPALGGCVFIKAPTPIEVPTPVPTPSGIQFDPSEGQPKGTALNKQGDATKTALPDFFRIALISSGQELVLQPVTTVPQPDGTLQVILGAADTLNPVKLAGILVPTGNQTGAGDAINVLQTWLAGRDLDVDIDPVFPTDTDNQRRVHIFFTARDEPFKGQKMSLNRLMVRSGNAVVDLYSPTSFDQRQWLYDEAHARENNLGLWKTDTFRRLQQRVKLPSTGSGAKSSVGLELPAPGQAPPPALVVPAVPGQTTTTSTSTTEVDPEKAQGSPLSPSPPTP